MALARKPGPWMLLAGAGMCTGGRILNQLENHLPDPTTLVLMGALSRAGRWAARWRRREGGASPVGRSKCRETATVGSASRPRFHARRGEPRKALHDCIQKRFGLRSEMPAYREVIEL